MNDAMNEMIENEMYKVRMIALRKLSSTFVHPPLLIDFALNLAYGFFESHKSAEKIADSLDLCKLDFLAIQEEFESFKEEYLIEFELAQNF